MDYLCKSGRQKVYFSHVRCSKLPIFVVTLKKMAVMTLKMTLSIRYAFVRLFFLPSIQQFVSAIPPVVSLDLFEDIHVVLDVDYSVLWSHSYS